MSKDTTVPDLTVGGGTPDPAEAPQKPPVPQPSQQLQETQEPLPQEAEKSQKDSEKTKEKSPVQQPSQQPQETQEPLPQEAEKSQKDSEKTKEKPPASTNAFNGAEPKRMLPAAQSPCKRPTMAGLSALSHEDYTVGWICALPTELTAAIAMLDQQHPPLSQNPQDNNIYTLGQIAEHNVVVACLPAGQMGNNNAAT